MPNALLTIQMITNEALAVLETAEATEPGNSNLTQYEARLKLLRA